jgi:putative ABC transport system permease protein
MIKNYLVTAWRSLRRHSSGSLLNIFGLSAGMTSAVLVFLWVQNERSFDGYHADAGRIYRITTHLSKLNWTWETSPLALAQPIRTEIPEVENLTVMQPAFGPVFHLGTGLFTEKSCAYVDGAWFNVFHYDFLEGSAAEFYRHPFSLILTRTTAKKYFGNQNAVGRTIHVDTLDYRVAAVVKDNPINSSFQFNVLMPLDAYLANPENRKNELQRGNFNYLSFLKLRPAADPIKVGAKITGILNEGAKEKTDFMSLIPLKDMHFETDLTYNAWATEHENPGIVYIFTVLGVFLLVIACINYVNLTTARASLRAKEVGVRKIVGAARKSLFTQFIVESLVISAISLLITILFVFLAMPLFRELTGRNFTAPFSSPTIWNILGLTLLAATVLNGIYPGLLLSSFRPLNVLRGTAVLRFKDVYLRKGLVVLQFTFSIILIIGTSVIQRQLYHIQNTNPGYNRSQVFWFYMPWETLPHVASVKQELRSRSDVSGVTVAGYGSVVKIVSSNSGSADWDGHDKTFNPTVFRLVADEDYAKVLQLQMAQGSWFNAPYPADQHHFILNETAVNLFTNLRKPVIGQRFSFDGDTGRIIGVVKDFHFASLHEKINPLVIYDRADSRTTVYVKTRPRQAATALAEARAIWQRYVPGKPFDYTFLDDEFNALYRTDQKVSALILVFSIIAIFISCLGLFGLAAFTAQRRIREIGIRKVLGATISNIIVLLSWEFLRLVLIAVLIAIPIAWWSMHRWLEDFAYHIPLGAWVFTLAGAIAIGIALLTVGSQSVKAASANPAKNLRTD